MKRKLMIVSLTANVIAGIIGILGLIGWYLHHDFFRYIVTRDRAFYGLSISVITLMFIISFTVRKNRAIHHHTKQIRQDSEAQILAIFNAAPDAVIVMDDNGDIVQWNPQSERLFGWSALEVTGKPVNEVIIPPRHREANQKELNHFLKTGKSPVLGQTTEIRAVNKQGAELDIAFSISPAVTDGRYWFIGFVRDISEKKQVQKRLLHFNEELEHRIKERTEKLVSSENLYSNLSRNMLHGFAYCKAIFQEGVLEDYIYLSVNSEYESMTGLQNITGKKLSDVMPGLLRSDPGYVAIVSRVALSGKPEKFETYVETMDKWLSITLYSPVKGYFVGLVDNITERRRAEEALRQSEIRLKEAQSIAHICNWDIDLVQNKHTWSEEFFKLYGINQENILATEQYFIAMMHPEDTVVAQQKMHDAFELLKDSSFEFRFIRADGEVRTGCTKWKFEFDEQGKPLRLFGILQDITDRKEAENNLRCMEQEMLEQKNMEQKKIVRAIINAQEKERNHLGQELHDNINQILASTRLYLCLAGDENETTKQANKYPMELIDNSIEEIRLLCQQLVTPLKDVRLNEMIEELLVKFDQNTGITTHFIYSMPGNSPSDDLKLNIYRIIQEQINNISKHAKAKYVTISIEKQDRRINIIIADNGKGFDVSCKRKGVGISNMINRIESFGGNMEIESSPGHGCRISIHMPC